MPGPAAAGGSLAFKIIVRQLSNHRPEEAGSTPGPPTRGLPSFAACLRALSSTYASASRTSRGVRSTRTWQRSARTGPRRKKTRFTARANRALSDFMPRPSAAALAASDVLAVLQADVRPTRMRCVTLPLTVLARALA